MNMELGKVYVVDDGEYKPIGHIEEAELTAIPSEEAEQYNRLKVTLSIKLYFDNNDRKQHGLPLRRGCVNKRFKESMKLLSRWIYV